uniref:Uncharacterized protein n=1 Tax=Romanomermis culicivorax TaxID=13658 RepID=A0A915KGY6_ROMCU
MLVDSKSLTLKVRKLEMRIDNTDLQMSRFRPLTSASITFRGLFSCSYLYFYASNPKLIDRCPIWHAFFLAGTTYNSNGARRRRNREHKREQCWTEPYPNEFSELTHEVKINKKLKIKAHNKNIKTTTEGEMKIFLLKKILVDNSQKENLKAVDLPATNNKSSNENKFTPIMEESIIDDALIFTFSFDETIEYGGVGVDDNFREAGT